MSRLLAEPPVDQRLHHLPDQVGDEQDHDAAQRAAQQAGQEGVAAGHLDKIDVPGVGKQEDRAGDQERPDAAIEKDRREAPAGGCFSSIPRPRNMTARHLGDLDRRRQEERDRHEPEQAHESPNPKTPEQNQAEGQEPGGRLRDRVVCGVEPGARARRPGPNDIESYGEEPKPEGIGHELACLGREPQGSLRTLTTAGPTANHPTKSASRRYQKWAASSGSGTTRNRSVSCDPRVWSEEKTTKDQGQAQDQAATR